MELSGGSATFVDSGPLQNPVGVVTQFAQVVVMHHLFRCVRSATEDLNARQDIEATVTREQTLGDHAPTSDRHVPVAVAI